MSSERVCHGQMEARKINIEDVKLTAQDCYGDSLDLNKLVVGFGGEICEVNGVVRTNSFR